MTNIVVVIKLAVVVFFVVFGAFFISTANWSPFVPPPEGGAAAERSLDTPLWELIFGSMGAYGFQGLIAGAALVFFAYIGFDIVASAVEETRRPQRDLPVGILGSLGVAALLYVLVSLVMTGVGPYPRLDTAAPMATALAATGANWATGLVSLGAILGATTSVRDRLPARAAPLRATVSRRIIRGRRVAGPRRGDSAGRCRSRPRRPGGCSGGSAAGRGSRSRCSRSGRRAAAPAW